MEHDQQYFAHAPVDDPTPMHTWAALTGLRGLLIAIKKEDMNLGGKWERS